MQLSADSRERTALLVIDMQNGFCHREGTIGKSDLDVTINEPIIPRIGELVEACHAAGMPVLWSLQEHTSFDATRARHRVDTHTAKLQFIPCLRGTWDADLLDDLKGLVAEDDLVFTKHRASCFYNTNLEVELRMRGIDTLIITGVSSNYCVDATIRDAYARDLDLYIVEDACSCPWPDLHDAVMKTNAIFHGEVLSTEHALEALRALGRETESAAA
jgi:ureidoacrylate peracid hydrolase